MPKRVVLGLGYEYSKAHAKWAPYERQYDDLKRSTDLGRASLRMSTRIAERSFENQRKSLNRIEAVGVAFASAGYNLYGNSLAAVRRAKSQNHLTSDLTIEALPLVNVSTSVLVGGFNHGHQVSGPALQTDTASSVATVDLESAQPIGYPLQAMPSVFEDKDGEPLSILQRAFDQGLASGTFNAVVTRGAYCTGKTDMDSLNIEAYYGPHRLTWQAPPCVPM